MLNWLASVGIKAVLEWLLSLLIRFKEKLEHIEQGRQEVKDAIEKKEKEIDKAIEEANKTSANTSFDAAIDELLRSAPDYNGSNPMHRIEKPSSGSSVKTVSGKTT